MPPTFATVAEGATDHSVLENILLGYFKSDEFDSGYISPVQPLVDESGKQAPKALGGWEQVFCWLRQKKHRETFQYNDYIVIQIDTDSCESHGFDVSKTEQGQALTVENLIKAIRTKLEHAIGEDDIQKYSGRFHFAISVHSIECWLLPLCGNPQELECIHNCKQRVDNALTRSNKDGLRKDDVRTYARCSAPFRKRKKIFDAIDHQKSLASFCDSLALITSTSQTDPEEIPPMSAEPIN